MKYDSTKATRLAAEGSGIDSAIVVMCTIRGSYGPKRRTTGASIPLQPTALLCRENSPEVWNRDRLTEFSHRLQDIRNSDFGLKIRGFESRLEAAIVAR